MMWMFRTPEGRPAFDMIKWMRDRYTNIGDAVIIDENLLAWITLFRDAHRKALAASGDYKISTKPVHHRRSKN
jgi:hypothetical protein